jgi:transposase
MAHRHELNDGQWTLVEPLLSKASGKTGRPRRSSREMLNGIFWILRTGAPWRDLPERYGPWQTVYQYFTGWRADGTFDRLLGTLQVRLDRDGHIDWDLFCIDGSSVRAARAAAGASKKTPPNHPTTHWAAREADSAASSTWLLTGRASPSASK